MSVAAVTVICGVLDSALSGSAVTVVSAVSGDSFCCVGCETKD